RSSADISRTVAPSRTGSEVGATRPRRGFQASRGPGPSVLPRAPAPGPAATPRDALAATGPPSPRPRRASSREPSARALRSARAPPRRRSEDRTGAATGRSRLGLHGVGERRVAVRGYLDPEPHLGGRELFRRHAALGHAPRAEPRLPHVDRHRLGFRIGDRDLVGSGDALARRHATPRRRELLLIVIGLHPLSGDVERVTGLNAQILPGRRVPVRRFTQELHATGGVSLIELDGSTREGSIAERGPAAALDGVPDLDGDLVLVVR